MVRVVGARVCDILKDFRARQSESLGNGKQALGAEGSLGVDVEALALSTALVDWQLACDCKHVAQLGLAGSELA